MTPDFDQQKTQNAVSGKKKKKKKKKNESKVILGHSKGLLKKLFRKSTKISHIYKKTIWLLRFEAHL